MNNNVGSADAERSDNNDSVEIKSKWAQRYGSKYGGNRLPKTMSPKLTKALRLMASGHTKSEVCKQVGITLPYLNRCLSDATIRAEFERIANLVERQFVETTASAQAGTASTVSKALTDEVDSSLIEAIQRLRHIMNTSPSHQAQALAAKELLDLGQAKKRLALLDKGLEDGAEVSADDVRLLAQTVGDLRLLHIANFSPDQKATALRHFSASEEDLLSTVPDELVSTPSSSPLQADPSQAPIESTAPVVAPTGDEIEGTALPHGPSTEHGPTLPPTIDTLPAAPVIGPTIDEMIDGRA